MHNNRPSKLIFIDEIPEIQSLIIIDTKMKIIGSFLSHYFNSSENVMSFLYRETFYLSIQKKIIEYMFIQVDVLDFLVS